MTELSEIVKDFLVESHENLDQLDRDLVSLEQDPGSRDTLSSVFRTIHTIKGTCGFLGFGKLESVSHVGENLLSKLRDGEVSLTPDITSGLLAQVDAIRQMLDSIEQIGNEGETDYSTLCDRLTRLQQPDGTLDDAASTPGVVEPAPADVPSKSSAACQTQVPRECAPATAAQSVASTPSTADMPGEHPDTKVEQAADTAKNQSDAKLSGGNIRVDVGLLDKLMNRVGELVLARNQVLQFTSSLEDTTFLSTCQRLNLITTELQEGVMKTRMQPIDTIWSKFPRVVRDLALLCGKQVRIEMEGKETELDKTIVEAIKDPLTHLVRNSVDHGIENPETRVTHGKPAEGCLRLRAYHEGGQVNIEIVDDGAGLNLERIKHKAVERGLVTTEQAARMSDRELALLIFRPGFSTAEKITNVSGRGVGMDVVKTNIEKIGGTVDIQTQLGRGTTIRIKIPLTLAIIPALIVTCAGDRYAIPQISLLELVRLEGDQARAGIEHLADTLVYRLRGQLLPLVYLNRQLNLEDAASMAELANIVVLRADDRQFGLVVDEINDTEEIVVKPLGKQLKNLSLFAGATIMGDGQVALILDVLGIAQGARIVSESRERNIERLSQSAEQNKGCWQTLLLVGVGNDGRLAIPLSMVARLEEFALDKLERSMDREVVQYRGQILPLVRVATILGCASSDESAGAIQVVVCNSHGKSVGLVVERIIDIVETNAQVNTSNQRESLIGSTIIQQQVTDLLDVSGVIRAAQLELCATSTSQDENAHVQ